MAQLSVDVTRGSLQPMPIAIPPFVGAAGSVDELSQNVAQVVTADLKRSGLFAPVDPAAFIEPVVPPSATPNFVNWRPLNAQALVSGSVATTGDGRIMAEYRLWDVFSGQQLTGQAVLRRARQLAADRAHHRRFHLRAADRREGLLRHADRLRRRDRRQGAARQAAGHHGPGRRQRALPDRRRAAGGDAALLAVAPGDRLCLARRRPWHVYLLNIETGQREQIANLPNMAFSPRFSPDGQQVVLSLQQGGNCQHLPARPPHAAADPADGIALDRYGAVLFPGRIADRLRVRPRRPAAALRHERQRRRRRSASASAPAATARRSGRRAAT